MEEQGRKNFRPVQLADISNAALDAMHLLAGRQNDRQAVSSPSIAGTVTSAVTAAIRMPGIPQSQAEVLGILAESQSLTSHGGGPFQQGL